MLSRASKTIWVLRRMRALGVDRRTLVDFWKSEGRTHLEMASVLWSSSILVGQRRSLESWRLAMAAIVGIWAPSLTEQLSELGLEQMDLRRDRISLRFALSTATKSRHQDIFTAAATNPGRPGKHCQKYREHKARTSAYYMSAAPYLTRLLNSHH